MKYKTRIFLTAPRTKNAEDKKCAKKNLEIKEAIL